jgi:ubiquinone/menaquinone biosynthesis C-methylase UbiE
MMLFGMIKRDMIKKQYLSRAWSNEVRHPSLDIGCGTGNHMHAWKHVWPKSNIIGADISEDQLSKAREKHPTLKFVRGSYLDESLFDRDSFDVIACMYGAGQYTDKVDTLLRNAHTWLKPGGVYVFHGIDPARLCDGCHETASTSSLPLKVDSEDTVMYFILNLSIVHGGPKVYFRIG